MAAGRKSAQPAGGLLDLEGTTGLPTRDTGTRGRAWGHHAPSLQRRVSLVLVTRTQVQPVSLQTRTSVCPGGP